MPDFNLTFIYEYYKRINRYFYSNIIENEAPVIQSFSAIQVASDDEEAEYTSGLAFADTIFFDNYKEAEFHKGNVVVSRIRETASTTDNKVFHLKNGKWFSSIDPIVVLKNSVTHSEVATTDFTAFPQEGKIIMDDELESSQYILVTIPQDIDLKFAAELSSYDDDIDLSDVGIMWNNDERGLTSNVASRLPVAENVYISPTSPLGGEALYANYIIYDRNGNYLSGDCLSLGVTIDWYKNGSLQSAYKNILRIPGGAVQYGQSWYFVVTPHDEVRAGNSVSSASVAVGRGRPSAYNVKILPEVATTSTDLILTYEYSSPDQTPEDKTQTEVRWYLNGSLYSLYNDRAFLSASEVTSGQQWYATVRVYDGYNYGAATESNTVVINHIPPTIGSLYIDPSTPVSSDTLYCNYRFSSSEGYTEDGPYPNWATDHPEEDYPIGATTTRWYKNGILQESLNNYARVESSLTTVGNQWYVEVTPGDGVMRGVKQTSAIVTIAG